jgi:hypothetical protein
VAGVLPLASTALIEYRTTWFFAGRRWLNYFACSPTQKPAAFLGYFDHYPVAWSAAFDKADHSVQTRH